MKAARRAAASFSGMDLTPTIAGLGPRVSMAMAIRAQCSS